METNAARRLEVVCLVMLAIVSACISGCYDSSTEARTGAPRGTVHQETPQADSAGMGDGRGPKHGRSLDLPGLPAKVGKVLRYIDEHHEAPSGYEGGRPFGNHEDLLPKRDTGGRTIHYQEWDVNPKATGKNRGPERLVTGSDGSAYYSPDHYRTFIKIR